MHGMLRHKDLTFLMKTNGHLISVMCGWEHGSSINFPLKFEYLRDVSIVE